ncbi:hypothetical protein B7463_g6929, partial [Scytalidium lignicola]
MQSPPTSDITSQKVATRANRASVKSRARYTLRACAAARSPARTVWLRKALANIVQDHYEGEHAAGVMETTTRGDDDLQQQPPSPGTLYSAISTDHGLSERLLRLENEVRNLRNLRQSDSVNSDSLIPTASHDSYDPALGHCPTSEAEFTPEAEEGIHEIQCGYSGYVSIAIQIELLKNVASQNSVPGSRATESTEDWARQNERRQKAQLSKTANRIKCYLPSNQRLDYLVQLFFREFGVFYPCIELEDFCDRLSDQIQDRSQDQTVLYLSMDQPECISFWALTSMVLAVAEFLDTGATTGLQQQQSLGKNSCADKGWYRESKRLCRLCPRRKTTNLNILRLHILEAIFTLMLEDFRESSHAISAAVDLAFLLDLHNESAWAPCSSKERRSRRVLWWTLYLFDRRISHKLGRTYLIPDSEVLVNDFCSDFDDEAHPSTFNQPASIEDQNELVSATSIPASSSYLYDQDWYYYLQFHVEWSRLFSKAWDALFGLRAPKAGDAEEIESIEALLLKLKRNLPSDLEWENFSLCDCLQAGVPDRKRINLLRLLIRHNMIRRDSQKGHECTPNRKDYLYTVQLCQSMATRTIEAITTYMGNRRDARSFGTYATMSIIECTYHLLSLPTTDLNASSLSSTSDTIEKAEECLKDMTHSRLRIANNALRLLEGVIDAGKNAPWRIFVTLSPPASGASTYLAEGDLIIHGGDRNTEESCDSSVSNSYETDGHLTMANDVSDFSMVDMSFSDLPTTTFIDPDFTILNWESHLYA